MKAKEGLKLVFGSVVVYVVMAACASGGPGSPNGFGPDASGSSGGTGQDGSGSSGGGTGPNDSSGAGILDALTDPVPEAKADTNQSGSRLKAKYYVGSDGSKTFFGMHDSMLNVDCYFQPATDGTTRCLPSYPAGALISTFFYDSGCAVPLAYVPKGCSPATYASQSQTGSGGCATAPSIRMFKLGTAYAGPLYTGSATNCSAQPDAGADSLRSSYDISSLGPEVAPSTFVAATVQTDP
jgi:hypothetical protein